MTVTFQEFKGDNESVGLMHFDSTGLLGSFKQLLSLDFIFLCVIHPVDW